MIDIEVVVTRTPGLRRRDLDRWIINSWVRADETPEGLLFRDIDVARVRLIQTLRDDMDVDEAALPVVLSLLDQIYDLRRRLRALAERAGLDPAEVCADPPAT